MKTRSPLPYRAPSGTLRSLGRESACHETALLRDASRLERSDPELAQSVRRPEGGRTPCVRHAATAPSPSSSAASFPVIVSPLEVAAGARGVGGTAPSRLPGPTH